MTEYLTQQQLQQLRALATAPRDKLLIDIQYQTGCTVTELVNIQRQDITTNAININERTCYVSNELLQRLQQYLQTHNSQYVFPSRQAPNITPKRVQQIIKPLLQKLDPTIKKQTPHILRYTHIAHALQKNIPATAIMQQTGLQEQRLSQLLTKLQPNNEQDYRRMFT